MTDISHISQPPAEEWSVFTKRQKIMIIFFTSCGGFFSPVSSAIYFPAIQTLARDFDKSTSLINLTITTYMIFQGLAPSFFGVLAEHVGKRPVYLITFTIYIAADIGLALQSNYAALLVLRCLQSTGSSATVALAISAAGDIARGSERGTYVGWTSSGLLIGPAIGPIIGGLLAGSLSWRSIFWFLAIMGAIYVSMYALICPETARSVVGNGSITPPKLNQTVIQILKTRRAEDAKRKELSDVEKNVQQIEPSTRESSQRTSDDQEKARPQGEQPEQPSQQATPESEGAQRPVKTPTKKRKFHFPNPLESLILFREVDIAVILFYNSLLFGMQYQMMASTVTIFKETYGYTDIQLGLCYMPYGFATLVSSVLGGKLSDWNFKRIAREGNFEIDRPKDSPENLAFPWEKARLQIAAPSALAAIVLMMGYGWSVNWPISVAVPLVLQFFLGLTAPMSTNVFSVMLVDRYPDRSASVSAANNVARCLYGAGSVAAIEPMLTAMGRGPCFTFIAGVALFFSPMMYVLLKYGPKWRKQRICRTRAMES